MWVIADGETPTLDVQPIFIKFKNHVASMHGRLPQALGALDAPIAVWSDANTLRVLKCRERP